MKFSSIDLFSGVGTHAYALRSLSRPVLYCENDKEAQRLLASVMRKGLIGTAPVHGDVRSLIKSEHYRKAIKKRPLLLTGSWPCQGNSQCGKRLGLADHRSGLLRTFCKIIRDARPEVFFAENTPEVEINGSLDFLLKELKGDYDIRWGTIRACKVGIPQLRKRFFCIGVRKGFDFDRKKFSPEPNSAFLPGPEPPRTVKRRSRDWAQRMRALGNAVVPACSYAAFCELAGWPKMKVLPIPKLNLVLDPKVYAPPAGYVPNIAFKDSLLLKEPYHKTLWATPRTGCLYASHYLTLRSKGDLPTMVRFEKDTPDDCRGHAVSCEWVEWLMGFPQEYTKAK